MALTIWVFDRKNKTGSPWSREGPTKTTGRAQVRNGEHDGLESNESVPRKSNDSISLRLLWSSGHSAPQRGLMEKSSSR